MLISIKKIFTNGEANYKGLDIDKFVDKSQSYNFNLGECVVDTTEDIDVNNFEDVTLVTQEEYNSIVQINIEAQKSPEQRILEEIIANQDSIQEVLDFLIMGGV